MPSVELPAGLYFMHDLGDTYRTGKITAAGDAYLLEFDCDKVQTPLELVSLAELMSVCCEAGRNKCFSLFRTRADLDTWLAYLDEPVERRPVELAGPLWDASALNNSPISALLAL